MPLSSYISPSYINNILDKIESNLYSRVEYESLVFSVDGEISGEYSTEKSIKHSKSLGYRLYQIYQKDENGNYFVLPYNTKTHIEKEYTVHPIDNLLQDIYLALEEHRKFMGSPNSSNTPTFDNILTRSYACLCDSFYVLTHNNKIDLNLSNIKSSISSVLCNAFNITYNFMQYRKEKHKIQSIHEEFTEKLSFFFDNIYLCQCSIVLIRDSIGYSNISHYDCDISLDKVTQKSKLALLDMSTNILSSTNISKRKYNLYGYSYSNKLCGDININSFISGNSNVNDIFPYFEPELDVMKDLFDHMQMCGFKFNKLSSEVSGLKHDIYEYQFALTTEQYSLIASQVLNSKKKSSFANQKMAEILISLSVVKNFMINGNTQDLQKQQLSRMYDNYSIGFRSLFEKYLQYIDGINYFQIKDYNHIKPSIKQLPQYHERYRLQQIYNIYLKILSVYDIDGIEFDALFSNETSIEDFQKYMPIIKKQSIYSSAKRKKYARIYENHFIKSTMPITFSLYFLLMLLNGFTLQSSIITSAALIGIYFYINKYTLIYNNNAIEIASICFTYIKLFFDKALKSAIFQCILNYFYNNIYYMILNYFTQ